MGDMVVVNVGEEPSGAWQASVFLAGPMPRDPDLPSWRPGAVDLLGAAWTGPGTLVVFVPEARDRHHPTPGYVRQLWEERWMAVVDVMLFWVPRDMSMRRSTFSAMFDGLGSVQRRPSVVQRLPSAGIVSTCTPRRCSLSVRR